MKKIALTCITALILAGCGSKNLEKASLEYKVFPNIANYKYEFNVAIPQVVDARKSKFVLNNDDYFNKPITKSLSTILFNEIKSTNAFNTVDLVDKSISFNPTSSAIQDIRRTTGQDAIFLAQINKFNVNIRKLSDTDTSNFVNLRLSTNITYKLILTDSETVIFLTTKDSSIDKTVELNSDIYKYINEMAVNSIKNNIVAAKKDFILTTKGTYIGNIKQEPVKQLKPFKNIQGELTKTATPTTQQEAK